MLVETGRLMAHSLPVYVATDGVNAGRAEDLQQEQAQPVASLWQCQGRRPLLPPVGFPDQEPDRDQGQGHVVMPALPGTDLVLLHPRLTLAAFEAGFHAQARG